VKIVCISGMVEEDRVGDLKAAGADDFMHKPFEIERLVARMCQLLDMEPVSAT
jgi:two-component system, OmpR family, response regulator